MPRFFTNNINGDVAYITGEDAKHLATSLRAKIGDEITLCDTLGSDYTGLITEIDKNSISFKITDKCISPSEAKVKITLFMAMPKGDKAETVIQKSVELGVHEIVFVLTKRCVSRPDSASWVKKQKRFEKIALEAAKQSGRGIIPAVCGILSFKEAVEKMSNSECGIIFYENSTEKLSDVMKNEFSEIAIMVGSEGGFEAEEVKFAMENGIHSLSLGKRILRCETAPLSAISAIMYACGEF